MIDPSITGRAGLARSFEEYEANTRVETRKTKWDARLRLWRKKGESKEKKKGRVKADP